VERVVELVGMFGQTEHKMDQITQFGMILEEAQQLVNQMLNQEQV